MALYAGGSLISPLALAMNSASYRGVAPAIARYAGIAAMPSGYRFRPVGRHPGARGMGPAVYRPPVYAVPRAYAVSSAVGPVGSGYRFRPRSIHPHNPWNGVYRAGSRPSFPVSSQLAAVPMRRGPSASPTYGVMPRQIYPAYRFRPVAGNTGLPMPLRPRALPAVAAVNDAAGRLVGSGMLGYRFRPLTTHQPWAYRPIVAQSIGGPVLMPAARYRYPPIAGRYRFRPWTQPGGMPVAQYRPMIVPRSIQPGQAVLPSRQVSARGRSGIPQMTANPARAGFDVAAPPRYRVWPDYRFRPLPGNVLSNSRQWPGQSAIPVRARPVRYSAVSPRSGYRFRPGRRFRPAPGYPLAGHPAPIRSVAPGFPPPDWAGRQWNGGDPRQGFSSIHRSSGPSGSRVAGLRQHDFSHPTPVMVANADVDQPGILTSTAGLGQIQVSQYRFR